MFDLIDSCFSDPSDNPDNPEDPSFSSSIAALSSNLLHNFNNFSSSSSRASPNQLNTNLSHPGHQYNSEPIVLDLSHLSSLQKPVDFDDFKVPTHEKLKHSGDYEEMEKEMDVKTGRCEDSNNNDNDKKEAKHNGGEVEDDTCVRGQ